VDAKNRKFQRMPDRNALWEFARGERREGNETTKDTKNTKKREFTTKGAKSAK
jgi:hypothetical protein